MRVVQLEIPESGSCVVKVPDDYAGGEVNDPVEIIATEVREMINDGAPGDMLTITLLEMSKKEYNKLPEWTGW